MMFGLLAALLISSAHAEPYTALHASVVRATAGGGYGTAFLVQARSGQVVLVSNYHVCSLAEDSRILVSRPNDFENVPARVLAVDPAHDLCVMSAVPGHALTLADRSPLPGDAVYTYGWPQGEARDASGVYTKDTYARFAFEPTAFGCHQDLLPIDGYCHIIIKLAETTARIAPGASGSPATDSSANVIGVFNSYKIPGETGSFVALKYLRRFLGTM
jgi:S1-C subfamily serine protease